jgi:peptidoglycan/LPS O-acetylase OafA/YrhL
VTEPAQNARHIDLIDYARGVAIIAVLLCHTAGCGYNYDFNQWDGWFRKFFEAPLSTWLIFPATCGYSGVALFFVISGFCIHLNFQQQRPGWGTFFLRRFFRIYPAYVAALIFFVLLNSTDDGDYLGLFKSGAGRQQFFSHFFLAHNFSPATFKTINGSFWSLAIEAQLYLLYPLFQALVSKLGWRRCLGLLLIVELGVQGGDEILNHGAVGEGIWGRIADVAAMSPLGYWFSWGLGAFLAEAFLKKQALPFSKISPLWWITLAGSTYLVRPLVPFSFTASAIASAVLLDRFLTGRWPAAKIQGAPFTMLKNMGVWSYSIYLLHQPLLFVYLYGIEWFVPVPQSAPLPELLLTFLAWLPIIPVAVLWYHCVELPGIAAGKRLIQSLAPERAQPGRPVKPRDQLPSRKIYPRYAMISGILLILAAGTLTAKKAFSPRNPYAGNNLAWSLATSSDAKSRNGALAVTYAEDACQQTNYQIPVMVGTLAAAYAEAGRFDDAVATARKACRLASQAGDQALMQHNEELLALYLKHQPYHEPTPHP